CSGTARGMETTWAPMISFCFQPKPFCDPYNATIVGGAAAGGLWQTKQEAELTFNGRERVRNLPTGVSRMAIGSVLSGWLRKSLMMSLAQSTARSLTLVGFSVGSR